MAMALYPGSESMDSSGTHSLLILGGITPDGKTKSDSARKFDGGGVTEALQNNLSSPDYFLDNQRVDEYKDNKITSMTFLGVNKIYQVNFEADADNTSITTVSEALSLMKSRRALGDVVLP